MCILTVTTRVKFDFNTTPGTEDMASYISGIFSVSRIKQTFPRMNEKVV